MQTSQVTNPASVLSSPAPASKQADNKESTESFGQVLSREVADRQSAAEPVKAPDTAKQPAGTSKPTNAKAADKTKEDADAPADTADATSQVSDDILALVANLNKIVAPATESGEEKPALQDGKTAIDPALVLAANAVAIKATPVAAQLPAAQPADDGAQRKPEPALALSDLGGNDKARQQLDPAAVVKADVPVTTPAIDLAAKGQELLNATAKPAAATDFATEMKDAATATAVVAAAMQAAPQSALQATQALAVHASDKLTPAVGTPAWDQALGQKVVWMVAGGEQSASLTLNPPDLGPLQVVLSVTNSHASATFSAAQPEVRQALETALPKLREMLGEAGIQLGQATVNSGSQNQQSAPDQQARRGFGQGDGRGDAPIQPVRVGRVQPASSGQGLVDTFV